MVSDLVWSRVAYITFLYGKSWFLFTLLLFIGSQSILEHLNEGDNGPLERNLVFAFRSFIYCCSMTQLIFFHMRECYRAKTQQTLVTLYAWIQIPKYLTDWQNT